MKKRVSLLLALAMLLSLNCAALAVFLLLALPCATRYGAEDKIAAWLMLGIACFALLQLPLAHFTRNDDRNWNLMQLAFACAGFALFVPLMFSGVWITPAWAVLAVVMMAVMGVLYLNVDRMGQPEELLPLIRPYFALQLASLPFVMLFNGFKQFADGITDTRLPMYIMIGGNAFNILGNYVLIYGKLGLPDMGATGAGISTLLTRVLMPALFAVIFFWGHPEAASRQPKRHKK